MTLAIWKQRAKQTALVLVVILAVTATGSALLWRDRPTLDSTGWQAPPDLAENNASVTATWLGVTTLLFDDGESQILIDGFFFATDTLELNLGGRLSTTSRPLTTRFMSSVFAV